MSLSLDDYEDVKQEERQSAAIEAAAAAESASVPASGAGIKPPTAESHSSGLNIPGLINQAWESLKPALNPVHYKAGGAEEYTNIDMPTTVAHGLGLGAVGLGLGGRVKRTLSGESAGTEALRAQTELGKQRAQLEREQFEYQKQQDAAKMRQVEQKVISQAAGEPAGRIEPTMGPEPVQPPPAAAAEPVAPKAPPPAPQFPQGTVQQPSIGGYGQTTMNAPTGAPSPLPPAPPQEPVAPQPKPVSELEQLRIEKARFELEAAKAKEARAAEAHANRLAADAKRAEAKNQSKPGGINPQDRQMLESSERAKVEKALDASGVKKAPKPTVAAVPPPAVPNMAPPSQSPTTVAEAQVLGPTIGTPQEVAKASTPAPTEVKGAKAPKWPGGAEGSAVQLFGGTKKSFTPESQAAVEMFKEHVGGPLTMPPTGGTIHQIDKASEFYEKYTGSPLPRNAEGKLTRIPEEQMQKLHSGIRSELEEAVKGNKLGNLGKGAMAAAALLGLTGAVQAAQKGDFGPLRQAGFDIGGPVALGKLGIAALSRAAGTGFGAATYTGNLNEGEEKELARRRHEFEKESQKLGSPFRSVPPPR